MAAIKTQETDASVTKFFGTLKDPAERDACSALSKIFAAATKAEPKMWGKNIVGFGHRLIAYSGGKTGEWMVVGFSPRKAALALYLGRGVERYPALLAKLGPYKTEGGCMYLKGLAGIDQGALKKLVTAVARDILTDAPKAATPAKVRPKPTAQ